MSWSRRLAPALAAVALALAPAACGFQPLYRQGSGADSVPQMAAVEIAPAPDRATQIVRNHLLDRLSPRGQSAEPLYVLSLRVQEAQSAVLITREETVTRYNLNLSASFALHDKRSGAVVHSGSATSLAAYNVLRADFANLVAEDDARARAAREVSEQIRTRLAIYFSRRAAQP